MQGFIPIAAHFLGEDYFIFYPVQLRFVIAFNLSLVAY